MGVNNLLKVITRQRSWWARTRDLWVTGPRSYYCATEPS